MLTFRWSEWRRAEPVCGFARPLPATIAHLTVSCYRPMLAASTLSPTKALILGSVFLCASGIILALTIFRFAWMRQRIPFLLRWGRGSWSFPASRWGVAAGSIVGLAVGCAFIDMHFQLLPSSTWGILILSCIGIALVAAIYDFRLHRRRDN